MSILVLARHGQSLWNLDNRFTGNMDIDLTSQGRNQALITGERLSDISFDAAFTSELKRAWQSLEIILARLKQQNIPIHKSKALNERCYGTLQGFKKNEVEKTYGKEIVTLWRRSYEAVPPGGESLRATRERVLPYFKAQIETLLRNNKNVLVVAHGNSLRALIMYIENISAEKMAGIELPTGDHKIFLFNEQFNFGVLPVDKSRPYAVQE